MKTSLKIACAIAASVAFLACSNNDDSEISVRCKQSAQAPAHNSMYYEPYMNLDSSCKTESKKLVLILDIQPMEKVDCYPEGYSAAGGWGDVYWLNDVEVSLEELLAFEAEWYKKKYECDALQKHKRDLPIPCVLIDQSSSWIASLTEEETAELQEIYGELYIDFDAVGTGVFTNGGNGIENGIDESNGCNM